MHNTFPVIKSFAWQDGYAAFSVSVSHVANTIAYIERQEEHHAKRDFASEWKAFLKTHGFISSE